MTDLASPARVNLVVVLTIFAISTSGAMATEQALGARQGLSPTESKLHVTEQGFDRLSGWFEGPTTSIAFETRADSAAAAVVAITTQGLRLDVKLDLTASVAILDGVGRVSASDRPSLQAFALVLATRLESPSHALRLEEQALIVAAALLGEAPVGWQPTHTEVLGPDHGAGSAGSSPTGGACQQADQDGVDHLDGGCSFEPYDDICHDAQGFCFTCETVLNGCNISASCPGNCLPGCSAEGRGWYTRDCAEHDRCCSLHSGCLSFGRCMDEFFESIDDILFGWNEANCIEGCAAKTSVALN